VTDFKVFVNFKTYPQGTGEKAVELAKAIREVSQVSQVSGESGIQIIPVVQAVDVFQVRQAVDIPVWVQHLDFQPQGQFTGWVNLEAIVEAGASGTLLNHSEHQIPPGTIKQILSKIQNTKYKIQNFEVMVCCKTLGQMERLVKLKPDFIGYEISELIGGEVSIVDRDSKSVKHALEICGKTPLVVGAGVHKAEDLKRVRQLGCAGVLISSAIVLADDPKQKLREIFKLIISAQEV